MANAPCNQIGVAKKGSEGIMSNLAGISYDRAGKRRSTMLIMESLIGYVCFFTVNFIYDTYIKKAKAPFGHLAVISLVQTAIALGIFIFS